MQKDWDMAGDGGSDDGDPFSSQIVLDIKYKNPIGAVNLTVVTWREGDSSRMEPGRWVLESEAGIRRNLGDDDEALLFTQPAKVMARKTIHEAPSSFIL
jgi:hypothetical protein